MRRKLHAKKKRSHMTGRFGLSTEPETLINEQEKKKKNQEKGH